MQETPERQSHTHTQPVAALSVKGAALTGAILWGLAVFLGTWWIIMFDGASADPSFVAKIYRGYTVTPAGSFIGLLWAVGDGLLGGGLFAWLYNRIALTKS